MLRKVVRNVASNWVGQAVVIVIGFWMSPILVRSLGDDRYGSWTMIVALIGYLGFLDLGISQGVLQYVARYRVQQEDLKVNETVSTASAVLLSGAILSVAAGAVIALLIPYFVEEGHVPLWKVQVAFFIMGINAAMLLLMGVYNAIIVACEGFHIQNLIQVCVRIAGAFGIVWVLSRQFGLLGVAVITLATTCLALLGRIVAAYGLHPKLKVRPRYVSRSAGGQLLTYGVWMFVMRVFGIPLGTIDLVMVGLIYGPVGATFYGIAYSVMVYAQSAIQGLSFVMAPIAISSDASPGSWRLRSVLLRSSSVGLVLSGTFFVAFLFWGEDFIRLWMEKEKVDGVIFTSSAAILSVASFGRVLLYGLVGPQQVMIGMRRVKFLTFVVIGQFAVTAAGCYVCAKLGGPLWAAGAMGVAALGFHAITSWYACRLTQTGLFAFIRDALAPPALTMMIMAGACIVIRETITLSGWGGLVLKIGVSVGIAAVTGTYLCFRPAERREIYKKIGSAFSRRAK